MNLLPPATYIDHGEPSPPAIEVLDKTDPIIVALTKMPDEFLIQSELGLEQMIREKNKGVFDRTLGLLKIMFWDEYRRSLVSNVPMDSNLVWPKLVSEKWWNANVLETPLNLAWILAPPAEEGVLKREMLILGMKRLREALDLPLREKVRVATTGEDGKKKFTVIWQTNVSLLKEIHSIVRTLQDRVYGAVAQQHNIMQRSMNLNIDAKGEEVVQMLNPSSMDISLEELDAYANKLKGIQKTIVGAIEAEGEVIDA